MKNDAAVSYRCGGNCPYIKALSLFLFITLQKFLPLTSVYLTVTKHEKVKEIFAFIYLKPKP